MSSPSTERMKRRRDSNHTENTEEKTRSLKQAKTKSPVSFLRHRLFGPSRDQNEESSLKTREVTRDSVKSVPRPGREAIINSGDGEDNSAIVCYRGSAAYAVLRQLNREPHDGVVFSEDQDQTHSWLNQGWNIDLSQEVEPEREISSPLPLFHDSDDCQQQEVLPEIIRRNEVLPQEKPFKIGDYASVRQYNINVGSGT